MTWYLAAYWKTIALTRYLSAYKELTELKDAFRRHAWVDVYDFYSLPI